MAKSDFRQGLLGLMLQHKGDSTVRVLWLAPADTVEVEPWLILGRPNIVGLLFPTPQEGHIGVNLGFCTHVDVGVNCLGQILQLESCLLSQT